MIDGGGFLDAGAAAGVVLGIIQALKVLGLPARWAPLSAVVLGAAGGPFVFAGDPPAQIVGGIIAGLSAVGLYSTAAHSKPAPGDPPAGEYLRAVGPDRFAGDNEPVG